MKALINLLLMVIAWLLLRALILIAFVYSVIKLSVQGRWADLSQYFWDCALTLDISGNVICQHLFNDLMIKPNGFRFGKEGVTISKTLAVNKKKGTWYPIGKGLGWLLNKIDKNHLEDSKI